MDPAFNTLWNHWCVHSTPSGHQGKSWCSAFVCLATSTCLIKPVKEICVGASKAPSQDRLSSLSQANQYQQEALPLTKNEANLRKAELRNWI